MNLRKIFSIKNLRKEIKDLEEFKGQKTRQEIEKYIRKLAKEYNTKVRIVNNDKEIIPCYNYVTNTITLFKNYFFQGESKKDIIRQFVHELAHRIQYIYINKEKNYKAIYTFIDTVFKYQLKLEQVADKLAYYIYRKYFRKSGIKFTKKDFNWYQQKYEKIRVFKENPNNCYFLKRECPSKHKCEECDFCLDVISNEKTK